jgi:hypothetical protein
MKATIIILGLVGLCLSAGINPASAPAPRVFN